VLCDETTGSAHVGEKQQLNHGLDGLHPQRRYTIKHAFKKLLRLESYLPANGFSVIFTSVLSTQLAPNIGRYIYNYVNRCHSTAHDGGGGGGEGNLGDQCLETLSVATISGTEPTQMIA
jgi:hypothetical protein